MRGGINCFKNISTADGLPNDVAHGIAEDPHGNVWVSTYHGLACMRKDGEIVNYGCDNGLDTEQFYWNASLRLANGDLLFGSIDGLLVVKGIAPDGGVGGGNTVLTYLTSESGKHYNPTDDQRRIPEDEKSFEVAFSSLDFIGGGQGRFYYRMVGFDDNWRELPAGRNSVTYTNLSPGDYSLEVKYVDGGQSLNSAPVASFGIEKLILFDNAETPCGGGCPGIGVGDIPLACGRPHEAAQPAAPCRGRRREGDKGAEKPNRGTCP